MSLMRWPVPTFGATITGPVVAHVAAHGATDDAADHTTLDAALDAIVLFLGLGRLFLGLDDLVRLGLDDLGRDLAA